MASQKMMLLKCKLHPTSYIVYSHFHSFQPHENPNKLCSLCKKYPYSELFWPQCGKMWTRITPNTDTFHAVVKCNLHTIYLFAVA